MSKNYRAELVGGMGDPINGNPTGAMTEAGFAAQNLNWRYITMLVKDGNLEAAVNGAKAMNFRGWNLTMPHKTEVLKYIDELSPAAKIIGAVNEVVVREDGSLFGENTDGKGFVKALKDNGITPGGKTICILGAGGASRSIGVECALEGANKIVVINRNAERGENFVKIIGSNTDTEAIYLPWTASVAIPEGTDILINATCVGLHPDVNGCPDIDFETVKPGMVACDVVFNPVDTVFLTRCAQKGAKTIDGLGMLANQGAINYKLWTGMDAPYEVLVNQLKKEFE